jgi:hypothetical protein
VKLNLVMSPRRIIVPATAADREHIRIVQAGDVMPVNVRKVRNGDHWRKFMALCAFVAENHPRFQNIDEVTSFLKYATKHFTPMFCPDGSVLPLLKSIAFDAMDEGEFREWSAKAKAVIFDDLFPTLDRSLLESEITAWQAWT